MLVVSLWHIGWQVSDEGDVLYVLPKDYRSNLSNKSLRMKLEPILDKLKVSCVPHVFHIYGFFQFFLLIISTLFQ